MPSNAYVVDWTACTKCGLCVEKCPTRAIDLSARGGTKDIKVGSIILSTGFEEFDTGAAAQYGHGRYPNVLTSIELERLISQSGPTDGQLLRPSDRKVPRSVAFLQCVGSRDLKRAYCSYACCMYALKEAMMIKQLHPDTEVEIFYMDMRTFGKGYYRYYRQAVEMGIKFTRSRVPVVKQDFKTGDLLITTAAEAGGLMQRRFSMLVLSVGQTPSPQFKELAKSLGVELDESGFCETAEMAPVDTSTGRGYTCAAQPPDPGTSPSPLWGPAPLPAGRPCSPRRSSEWKPRPGRRRPGRPRRPCCCATAARKYPLPSTWTGWRRTAGP